MAPLTTQVIIVKDDAGPEEPHTMPIRLSPDETAGVIYVRDTCGRCGGSGQLPAYDWVTGGTTTQWCPICKGTGEAQFFQTHGNPNTHLPTVKRFADGRKP